MAQKASAGRMFASLTDAERLRRLSENVTLALSSLSSAGGGRSPDEPKERLTRMFAALSATNEAIMHARTRAELFQLVCEAAVHGGKFNSTIIGMAEPGEDFLRIAASAGPGAEAAKIARFAITTNHPEGRGLTGTAFRTRQPCVSNDYLADQRGAAFHGIARNANINAKACAALPLLNGGEVVGVLIFVSTEKDAFTPELVELLQRLAENVSFRRTGVARPTSKGTASPACSPPSARPTRRSCARAPAPNCSNWFARRRCMAASSPPPSSP